MEMISPQILVPDKFLIRMPSKFRFQSVHSNRISDLINLVLLIIFLLSLAELDWSDQERL